MKTPENKLPQSTDRCIITSASNKFFPSLLNLLGSFEQKYPDHPHIYVYDLGLSSIFRKELESIEWLTVIDIPHFSPFWRSCYTWKAYIFENPIAETNLYIDAGCEILRPLDEMFDTIRKSGYITVEQGANLELITPKEYKSIFPIDPKFYDEHCVTAGIFGFKKNSSVTSALHELYDCAIAGLCLGFSPTELWKNKGKNKTAFVRDCKMFRHDTTMLNLVLRKHIPNLEIQDVDKYGGDSSPEKHPEQLIWNFRMNYRTLRYISASALHKNPPFIAKVNRLIVFAFMKARSLRLTLKGK